MSETSFKPQEGNCELDGYKVEARQELAGVIDEVCGQTFGPEWKEVKSVPSDSGIPGDMWAPYLSLSHCMGYHQAMAFAWTFSAFVEAGHHHGMRIRVIRVKVKCSWSSKEDGVLESLPWNAPTKLPEQ